jgi:DNA-binding MarR family transcriptional regulator
VHQACLLLPGLARKLRVMKEDGLVLRRVDAQGRQSVVRINPLGRAILEKRWAQAAGFVIDLLAAYAEEKFERLLDLL